MLSGKELIAMLVWFAGFFLSYVILFRIIDSRWSTETKVKFGNFGLMPKHGAILFVVWLAVYLFLSGVIVRNFF